jgi:hypothetical protein
MIVLSSQSAAKTRAKTLLERNSDERPGGAGLGWHSHSVVAQSQQSQPGTKKGRKPGQVRSRLAADVRNIHRYHLLFAQQVYVPREHAHSKVVIVLAIAVVIISSRE